MVGDFTSGVDSSAMATTISTALSQLKLRVS